MRSRIAFVSLAVVVLAFAGCGGTNKATTTAAPTPLPPNVTGHQPLPPLKSATYNINLAGFKGGALHGSGLAVISINASSVELCWKFSQLMNVTAPTVARIYINFRGASGTHGLPLGSPYKSSGCVPESSAVLSEILAHPHRFYVAIHDAQFPGGAVHGQLQPTVP
jgi:hypothetical protein